MTRTEILLEKLAQQKYLSDPNEKVKKPGEALKKDPPKVPKLPLKKKEPLLADKKKLSVTELQKKYPESYKTKGDAVIGRVASTPAWNAMYKDYLAKSAPHLTAAVQADPQSRAAKEDVIAIHDLLKSDAFLGLPEDVRSAS